MTWDWWNKLNKKIFIPLKFIQRSWWNSNMGKMSWELNWEKIIIYKEIKWIFRSV